MTATSLSQSITLPELLHKIAIAEEALHDATKVAGQRLAAVLNAGSALIVMKGGVRHGEWLPWMEEHLEGITPRTAQKWMKLADMHRQGKVDLHSARGARQAYILAGIIPEVSSTGSKRASVTVDYVLHLNRLELALRKMDLANMTPEDKAVMKGRLEGVVRVYNAL